MLHPDFSEFVALLNAHKVEYLVVGGYAVAVYGHPRFTGDLDVWINTKPENIARLLSVLSEFGFGGLGLTPEDFSKPDQVIQMGYPPFRIDILTNIDGVTFEECYPSRNLRSADTVEIAFISYEDLKKNKNSTNRPIDRDDLDQMQG